MLTAVFCATLLEARPALEERGYGFRPVCEKPFRVWKNKTRVVVITGIGLVNASVAFAWAAEKFRFVDAVNIGAAGAAILPTPKLRPVKMGGFYKISKVSCIEPYNKRVYVLGRGGKTLATSSRPVSTRADREFAGRFGELVDMEGYALARAAAVFGKNLSMLKLVTDFSQKCDIEKNITEMAWRFASRADVWLGDTKADKA